MKSVKKIISMLVNELNEHILKNKLINNRVYYNELLGDTSFLLAGLLDSLLKENFNEWNKKWIDDCLITNVLVHKNKLSIVGIMIFGFNNTTEQLTNPFSFEIELVKDEETFEEFTFSFYNLDYPEITYEKYRDNRNYWMKINENWKYKIIYDSNSQIRTWCNGNVGNDPDGSDMSPNGRL